MISWEQEYGKLRLVGDGAFFFGPIEKEYMYMSGKKVPPPMRWYRVTIGTFLGEEIHECSTFHIFAQCRYVAWLRGVHMCNTPKVLISMESMGTIDDYQSIFGDRHVEAMIHSAVEFEEWVRSREDYEF